MMETLPQMLCSCTQICLAHPSLRLPRGDLLEPENNVSPFPSSIIQCSDACNCQTIRAIRITAALRTCVSCQYPRVMSMSSLLLCRSAPDGRVTASLAQPQLSRSRPISPPRQIGTLSVKKSWSGFLDRVFDAPFHEKEVLWSSQPRKKVQGRKFGARKSFFLL